MNDTDNTNQVSAVKFRKISSLDTSGLYSDLAEKSKHLEEKTTLIPIPTYG
jgi:hypothetical protein